jgi:hypothetical protein
LLGEIIFELVSGVGILLYVFFVFALIGLVIGILFAGGSTPRPLCGGVVDY